MESNTKPEIESEIKVKREEERNQRRDCINIDFVNPEPVKTNFSQQGSW